MNYTKFLRRMNLPAMVLVALVLAAAPSFAQTTVVVDLAAVQGEWTPPGGGLPIAMWGFVADTGSCPGTPFAWGVGPTLTATAGDTLTINVRNCLADPVSVFVPGQLKATVPVMFTDDQGRNRVRSFDTETGAGLTDSYTWTGVKEGTYLYHSGTHPQVQVQMGLYGALVVTGPDYPTVAQDEVLVYSEIDPALHDAVAGGTYGTPAYPSTFDYMPRYFLINGTVYPVTPDIAMTTGDVLLRFVNAGLKTHVPTLEGGLYMSLIAEDGNLYPFEVEQYGVELQAAKTIDAVVTVEAAGRFALYDRALGLTNWLDTGGGMLTYLQSSPAGCTIDADCDDLLYCNGAETCVAGACQAGTPPVCDNGLFCDGTETCNEATDSCDAGTPQTCDDGLGCTVDSCNLLTDSCDNLPDDTLCADDGLFCNGAEFCDPVLGCSSTGDPCLAGFTCNEITNFCDEAANVAPFANDDFATVTRNTSGNVINVTDNDVDADGTINVANVLLINSITSAGGTVAVDLVALDGTVLYTPKRGFRGTDTFTYTVTDNDGATSNVATVRVNVVR